MRLARIVVLSMDTILYSMLIFLSFRVGKRVNSLRLIERVVDLVTKRHICVEYWATH